MRDWLKLHPTAARVVASVLLPLVLPLHFIVGGSLALVSDGMDELRELWRVVRTGRIPE